MHITRESDYAVRCVLHLALTPAQVVMVSEIAGAMDIPRSFLAKILQKLARAGIVTSYRGVKGGFRLARDPQDISLLDVIEAMEGEYALNKCVIEGRTCDRTEDCVVHPAWVEISGDIRKRIGKFNFRKLAAQEKRRQREKRL